MLGKLTGPFHLLHTTWTSPVPGRQKPWRQKQRETRLLTLVSGLSQTQVTEGHQELPRVISSTSSRWRQFVVGKDPQLPAGHLFQSIFLGKATPDPGPHPRILSYHLVLWVSHLLVVLSPGRGGRLQFWQTRLPCVALWLSWWVAFPGGQEEKQTG